MFVGLAATHIFILLAAGAVVGFASGLLGVGGGFIIVPVAYWVIWAAGIPQVTAIRIAFGTSLLVVLSTAISGVWGHSRKKAVHWKAGLISGLCGLAGAMGGATLAAHLPVEILEVGFGGLVLAIALWIGLEERTMPRLTKEAREPKDDFGRMAACAFPIGIVSGLTGLGGGVLLVPALVLAFGFPMHMAIGTSLASVMLTSLGGIIGYVVNGIGVPGLLPYSMGYINLPIWLCLAATSIPIAQLGAKTSHALPAKQLRYIFIAVMVCVGLRMLGIF